MNATADLSLLADAIEAMRGQCLPPALCAKATGHAVSTISRDRHDKPILDWKARDLLLIARASPDLKTALRAYLDGRDPARCHGRRRPARARDRRPAPRPCPAHRQRPPPRRRPSRRPQDGQAMTRDLIVQTPTGPFRVRARARFVTVSVRPSDKDWLDTLALLEQPCRTSAPAASTSPRTPAPIATC